MLLRDVIVFYFRARSVDEGDLQWSLANRAQAQHKMWQYAKLVQQVGACMMN